MSIDTRPQPDGSYPFDYKWRLHEHLGEETRENKEPKIKAEALCGFTLDYWPNKAYYVFKVENGTYYAIYLHDYYWKVIKTDNPEAIKIVKEHRALNVWREERNVEACPGQLQWVTRLAVAQEQLNKLP